MFQGAIINGASSSAYTSTWISTVGSVIATARILVLYSVNPIMDYVSVIVVYGVIIVLQVICNLCLLPSVRELDRIELLDVKRDFDAGIEKVD